MNQHLGPETDAYVTIESPTLGSGRSTQPAAETESTVLTVLPKYAGEQGVCHPGRILRVRHRLPFFSLERSLRAFHNMCFEIGAIVPARKLNSIIR